MKLLTRSSLFFSCAILSVSAQSIVLPRQSPAASVSQTFAYTTATVTYGRPAVKGRVIWGGVVPYGQVWRAGANEATDVEFTTDVTVNGQPLPKGKYALFVLPEKTGWTFIFDSNPNVWGAFSYDGQHDVARVKVKPVRIPHQERLEYTFEDVTDSSAVLSLQWEKMRASLKIQAEFLETAKASILQGIPNVKAGDPFPWLNAARFFWTYDLDRPRALAWIEKSIQARPLYLNLWTKAEWLAEEKQYAAAVETGRRAWLEAAKDSSLEGQIPMLDRKLKAWGKKAKK